jgi:CheY-like chemotaxis protein
MSVRAPRLVLIVEDDSVVVADIVSGLREMGFQGPAFDRENPELHVFTRGSDQVHVTSFLQTAMQAATKEHTYALVIADSLILSTEKISGKEKFEQANFDPVVADLVYDQPQLKALLISKDVMDQLRCFLGRMKERGADDDAIDVWRREERFAPCAKNAEKIIPEIGRFLASPASKVQPGKALDRK